MVTSYRGIFMSRRSCGDRNAIIKTAENPETFNIAVGRRTLHRGKRILSVIPHGDTARFTDDSVPAFTREIARAFLCRPAAITFSRVVEYVKPRKPSPASSPLHLSSLSSLSLSFRATVDKFYLPLRKRHRRRYFCMCAGFRAMENGTRQFSQKISSKMCYLFIFEPDTSRIGRLMRF